jgi:integrase/recombinase XerD
MAVAPVVLPTSGHAAWDDPATWWVSQYKASTQQTYATYLPRWTSWCAGRGLNPLQAGRADVELWLRTVADSGLSRASTAGHYDAVASIYRLAFDENLIAINPCARIARPKVLRELQRREVLTVLEYAAFLTAARALGPTHHAIAVLGGMLGLRASEMAGLTVDSVSTVRGYVTLTFVGNGRQARPRAGAPARPARGHRRPHRWTAAAHPGRRRHGAPLGAPLRRPHCPDGRDQPAPRAVRLPPSRRLPCRLGQLTRRKEAHASPPHCRN